MEQQNPREYLQQFICSPDDTLNKDYECMICFNFMVNPVECVICKDKCRCCNKCVTKWKSTGGRCPKRCSTAYWQVQKSHLNPILCSCICRQNQPPFPNLEELVTHFSTCNHFNDPTVLQLKKNYLCKNKHPLSFYTSCFEDMVTLQCIICQGSNIRSECKTCARQKRSKEQRESRESRESREYREKKGQDGQYYCINCRPPPCCKTRCPLGHRLVKQVPKSKIYVCDRCGVYIKVGDHVHHCEKCNYGFCEDCHGQLGDSLDHLQGVSKNYCPNDHKLTPIGTQQRPCSICKTHATYFKYCHECNEYYCKRCRPVKYEKYKCEFGHSLHLLDPKDWYLFDICPRQCNQKGQRKFIDKQCNTVVCEGCHGELCRIPNPKPQLANNPNSTQQCKHTLELYNMKPFQDCPKCNKKSSFMYRCKTCNHRIQCLTCQISKCDHQKKLIQESCWLCHSYKVCTVCDTCGFCCCERCIKSEAQRVSQNEVRDPKWK